MNIEKEVQFDELCGKTIIIIADATPLMGDVFTLLTRFVSINDHNASVQHRRVHIDFISGSLNAATQGGAIQKGCKLSIWTIATSPRHPWMGVQPMSAFQIWCMLTNI
jgi:hypothetical protein